MSTLGLSSDEAARRLAERGPSEPPASSRSVASILRENVLTLFNLILGSFALALLATGQFADLVFVVVIVANASIGIVQELWAKRQLDHLALLVAPRAQVLRDGRPIEVPVEDVVAGDAVQIQPGDQVVADGTVVESRALQVDESLLTGESEAVARTTGESLQSGSFCVAGSGTYLAEKVGADAYANELVGLAQGDRQPLSPLQKEINRLLQILLIIMVPVGGSFIGALLAHQVSTRQAVSEATAGIVSLIPEGLVLLTSVTFAVAAGRMARLGGLVQRLNAIESLAGVDVVCVDKTGTLTDGTLRLDDVEAVNGAGPEEARRQLARYAASIGARNPTADALHSGLDGTPSPVAAEVPFSSRWKWSGLTFAHGGETLVLGAPDVLLDGTGSPAVAARASELARERKRVLLFARGAGPVAEPDGDSLPGRPPLEPLALAVLSERMRPEAADAVAFLHERGVEVKVVSGDGPDTVEAVARAAGIDTGGRAVAEADLPHDGPELARAAAGVSAFARVTPDGKRRLVDALRRSGRRVAMIGDGVNDVPALKRSDVAVALASGSQMARGVADLVLSGPAAFGVIPAAIGEGRRILQNLQRVAKLFVAKSVFAATLILTVGVGGGTYPFLPRQLSLAAVFTVGIPAFALAMAPVAGQSLATGFLRDIWEFAVPAGVVTAAAVLLGHGLVHTSLGRSLSESQTTSVTILVFVSLYLVLVLESGGMRRSPRRARMVPLLCAGVALAYLAILSWPAARHLFALAAPTALPMIVAVICTLFAIGALGAVGLSLTRPGGERIELVNPFRTPGRDAR
jgi:cation-transporting ATPase E